MAIKVYLSQTLNHKPRLFMLVGGKEQKMPELCRFLGIVIQMYFNDHMPPHFHAIYNDLEGVFELSTFEMLEGNLPARVKGLVVEWATLHQQDLLDNWNSLTNTGEYKKIDPLV